MFFSGAVAGAEVQRVVGINSVGGGGEAAFLRDCIEHREKFVLAIKTAVGGVRAVGGVFHFVSFDKFVMDLEGANELIDCGAIVRRETWGERGNGKRTLA